MSFTALVLAGSRGEADPAAGHAGVAHKGLILLGGKTLLARVAAALEAAGADRIAVSSNDATVLAAVANLTGKARILRLPSASGPSQSVADAFEQLGAPLVVTTVDHALLEAQWIERFLADTPADADVALLVAPEGQVRAAAPNAQRTWLRFRDGRYSGCNLFFLRTPRALGAVALWRRVEALRKQPWRIALMLGPGMLVRYGLGLLTLDEAVARLGRLAGVKAAAVRTPFGLAAIDVDKPADVDLVRALVEKA